ncbi:putative lipid II flippase FtsW [bacterium]|nr:putative lipid II flippase FtsW [bacterium]
MRGNIDITFLALTAILVGIGLIMVYSSSTILAMKNFGDSYFFIKRQMVWATMGFIALLVIARYPYASLRKWIKPAMVMCGVLLIAVLVLSIGKTVGGARRWLFFGPISFQPAEFLKVVLVLYMADSLVRKEKVMGSFVQGVLPHLMVLGAISMLLLMQPDLGTAIICILVGGGMIYLAGARLSHLVSLGLAALPVMFLLIYQVDYRRRRLDAFLDPWQEPLGKGFQVIQSYLAMGSGGLWGRGLCESQQKLFYLPAPHTDFIFSILGEELGFVGTFGLVLVFGFFLWRGFQIARNCKDRFGKLLALGLVLLLGVQIVINMGVTTGLVPTKGTTLPLISTGGSSLFFSMVAIGILLSISRYHPQEQG